MIYEEFVIARDVARTSTEMTVLVESWPSKARPKYDTLTSFEKLVVRKFYDVCTKHHTQKMTILAIESSIMLCFQTAILVFYFRQPPLRELDYQTGSSGTIFDLKGLPTGRWICLNVIFGLIKIVLSGYLTFALLTIHQNIRSYYHYYKPAGLFTHLATVTKAIIQIVAATGYIFLSGSKLPSSFQQKKHF